MKLIRILPAVLLLSITNAALAFTSSSYVVVNTDSTRMYGMFNVGPNASPSSEGA